MGKQMVKLNGGFFFLVILASLLACGGQQAQHNKNLSEAARGIGEAYMRQGDYTAALGKLLEAEKLNPEDPIVHHDLGLCYRAKKRMPDAIVHLEKAIALRPSYSAARNTLGRAYLETGKFDKAIAMLNELTRDALYATPHYPLANLGEAYFYKQEYNKAIEYFKQALKLQPDFIPALHGLGRAYVALGRGKLAIYYFEKALKLSPNVAQIHFDAAEAYEQVGNLRQAKIAYQSVVDLATRESDVSMKARKRLQMLR
jgi:type IV pilus assembly protein PilF